MVGDVDTPEPTVSASDGADTDTYDEAPGLIRSGGVPGKTSRRLESAMAGLPMGRESASRLEDYSRLFETYKKPGTTEGCVRAVDTRK